MKSKSVKTDSIQVRVQKSIKEHVEIILDELGLSTSQAVNIFFKQIIQKNGLPFEVALGYDPVPLNDHEISKLREAEDDIKKS